MKHHKVHVRDWMTAPAITITSETAVMTAFDVMRNRGIRRLPVVDQDGMLAGIVTRSDVQHASPLLRGEVDKVDSMFALAGMTVNEIMTTEPLTVTPSTTIRDAALQMHSSRVSGLPVVEDGRVVGVITESDIFRFVVAEWDGED